MITVQIVYAKPDKQTIINYQVEAGSNILQAILKSNILAECQITLDDHKVGIYGNLCALTDEVKEGDRIEIYRPLINDPKEIRRRRAALRDGKSVKTEQ
ncbi:RnfH family protein [Orbaceae bacterium ESL0721]|nr:RnfH family protein [Orbaceae bacterium ESL0721]